MLNGCDSAGVIIVKLVWAETSVKYITIQPTKQVQKSPILIAV
jgi:hypothetical protein